MILDRMQPQTRRYVEDYAELVGQPIEDVLVMFLDLVCFERIAWLVECGQSVPDGYIWA